MSSDLAIYVICQLIKVLLSIQSPGLWHKVYTPVKTITSGGHFYSFDALTHTEMSRAFDAKFSLSATNAEHDSSMRTLIRMALAIPYISQERCTSLTFIWHAS